jgi:hypothetical protein
MAMIISESKGKANPHDGINKRKEENNGQEILDNRELGLNVFVVHGGYSSG